MTNDLSYQVYSPTSVLGIFSNALKLPATINLIYLKGRYSYGGGKAYSNYYFDLLYSEGGSISIAVKMSATLRSKINNGDVYTLRGFIEKKVRNSSIELVFVVDEIVSQDEKQISEEDLQRFDLIRSKLEKGSRDLETFIREKKLKNESIRVANIFGNSAIVQRDFLEGLDVSQNQFEITDFTCNITSSTSILDKIREISLLDFHIVGIVRGGGDQQSFDAFNDVILAEYFIQSDLLTITAIGHTVDETLIDKLADKRFHLPHDYGAGLHNIIDKLSQEKSNSRAILIDEVKKDITKQFTEQVNTLGSQLKKKNEEFVQAQKTYKEQVENQTKSFNTQLKKRNEEVEKLKKDLSQKHTEQVQTLANQLKKKNEEFVESQKTYKEQVENQTKSFNDQLKARNSEVEKLKKDLSEKHTEQVKTIATQLQKKNEEFLESQKTYKEQVENQTKLFNEQLKIRNEEVDKLKKDLSEKHAEQVKTLQEQLTKRNDEFQKFQDSSTKQSQDLQKNFQDQQKQRIEEMENYKKEIATLHDKNIQSAVNEQTAQLSANLSNSAQEIDELKLNLKNKGVNYLYIVLAVVMGLLIGLMINRLF
ncbi:exodeoxyribonuclease VII large subunit [Kaistella antarctica]|uniref:Exodeoxyribonuclease VII large subunit n=1 Tax=Kaistella antarctica TaxID=266748 RepID=A0A448NUZ9_9FLAO|nr:exodeoxyribonuclease VII large subunit [Kaistella antarctica]KEY20327.1 hypothetical protein HY04_03750 [Kaistella antarctica]SEV90962.1 Exonuclease VII, large subunit [Kaistella antarctica]VEI01548.1 exodeoxyribonuclease VII large subunit [Kaistella antarctica]